MSQTRLKNYLRHSIRFRVLICLLVSIALGLTLARLSEAALRNWKLLSAQSAGDLQLTFFLTLLSNLYAPWLLAAAGGAPLQNLVLVLLYPARLLLLALLLAFWETLQVKARLRTILTPALMALAISLIAAMLVMAERYLL